MRARAVRPPAEGRRISGRGSSRLSIEPEAYGAHALSNRDSEIAEFVFLADAWQRAERDDLWHRQRDPVARAWVNVCIQLDRRQLIPAWRQLCAREDTRRRHFQRVRCPAVRGHSGDVLLWAGSTPDDIDDRRRSDSRKRRARSFRCVLDDTVLAQ